MPHRRPALFHNPCECYALVSLVAANVAVAVIVAAGNDPELMLWYNIRVLHLRCALSHGRLCLLLRLHVRLYARPKRPRCWIHTHGGWLRRRLVAKGWHWEGGRREGVPRLITAVSKSAGEVRRCR